MKKDIKFCQELSDLLKKYDYSLVADYEAVWVSNNKTNCKEYDDFLLGDVICPLVDIKDWINT